jgi:hypothetical protein
LKKELKNNKQNKKEEKIPATQINTVIVLRILIIIVTIKHFIPH